MSTARSILALLLLASAGVRFLNSAWLPATRALRGDFSVTFPAEIFARLRPDFPTTQVWEGWYYGPMQHFLTIPLFLVPRWSMVPAVWALTNFAALALSFVLACRLSGAFATSTADRRRVPWTAVAMLGSLWLLFQPLGTGFASGDIEIVEMTVILGALVALESSRVRLSGVLIGVATMIKFLPVGFLGWFLLRRQWRAAGAAVSTIAVIAAVTTVTLGWKENATLGDMRWAAVSPIAGLHELSVTSMFLHRAGILDYQTPAVRWFPSARVLTAARAGALASALLAVGVALVLIARRRRPVAPAEIAVLFMTMFMILPWNHDYYYLFALVPVSLLFLRAVSDRDRTLLAITMAAYLMMSPPIPFTWIDQMGWFRVPFAYVLNYYDVPTLGALLLWFAATYQLTIRPREDALPSEPRPFARNPGEGGTRRGLLAVAFTAFAAPGFLFMVPDRPASAPKASTLTVNPPVGRAGGPSLALSRDGRRLAYINDAGLLCTRRLAATAATCWPENVEATGPFFSPDGRWIGFFAGGALKKAPATGGPIQVVVAIPGGQTGTWQYDPALPAFGRDGVILFGSSAGISRIARAGEKPELLIPAHPDDGPYAWPTMLPSGETVLFAIAPPGGGLAAGKIVAASLKTGQRTTLMAGSQPHYEKATGQIVYTLGGRVLSVPFDPETLKVSAVSAPLVGNVLTTAEGGAQFALSDEGTLIYTAGSALPTVQRPLLQVHRLGSAVTLPVQANAFEAPRISPDGRTVAAAIRDTITDVWTYDLVTGSPTRLTSGRGPSLTLAWTPVGRAVSFTSFIFEGDTSGPGLFSAQADAAGREPALVWRARRADSHQPVRLSGWSPDGRFLAGTQREDLWLFDSRNGGPIVMQTPFAERNPVFSPNGRWIAYSSDRSGRDEIYVQAYPSLAEPHRITQKGGVEPLWSPDGRELFFRRRDSVMAVNVTTRKAFSADSPRLLFEGKFARPIVRTRNYDVAPDGQHFVMVGAEPVPPASREIRVLRGWSSKHPD